MLGPSGSDQRIGQALLDRGLQAWPQGDKVAVRISDPAQLDVVRDTVVDLDLGLVRIQEIRHTLEEVFHQQGAPA